MSAVFNKIGGAAVGADTNQLRELAQMMRQAAEQFEQTFQGIDAKINATTWSGADATRAETDWAATRTQTMNQLRQFVEQFAQVINAQADHQEHVSNS